MRRLLMFIGSFIVGLLIMGAWGMLGGEYGSLGGWIAALVMVGPTWFMNHYLGIFKQDGAWIDQGIAIGAAGVFKGVFLDGGGALLESVPLILVVVVAGGLGGILADVAEEILQDESEKTVKEMEKEYDEGERVWDN